MKSVCPWCGSGITQFEPGDDQFENWVFELIKTASFDARDYPYERKEYANSKDIIEKEFNRLYETIMHADKAEDLMEIRGELAQLKLRISKEVMSSFFSRRDEMFVLIDQRLKMLEGFDMIPEEDKDKKNAVLAIIREITGKDRQVHLIENVYAICKSTGMGKGQFFRSLEQLKREGEIFEPRRGYIQLI